MITLKSQTQAFTASSSLNISKPANVNSDDVLILHTVSASTISPPSGFTKVVEVVASSNVRNAVFFKVAGPNEPATYPVSAGASSIVAKMMCFSGVNKSEAVNAYGSTTTGTSLTNSISCQSVSYTAPGLVLFLGGMMGGTDQWATVPGYTEYYDYQGANHSMFAISKVLTAASGSTGSVTLSNQDSARNQPMTSITLVLAQVPNNPPTLTLTSPSNNQTLSEGNVFSIQGSAGDTDSGNVVTVKYKINNGPTRAIASGVSDGSSPISFARTLVYSNKRLWDGSTDVAGVDLVEGVDHTLTVWAEDDQGGKSAEVTRKFRVIWNRPPSISGANEDLGTIIVPPTKTYTVTEPEGNPFSITEKINGNVIRSFEGVAGREETVTIPHDLWIRLDLDTPHSLTVEATDSKGLTSTRTFTFTRKETHIEFMLDFDNPDVEAHFTLDGMPKRVLVTLERYLPPGSQIEFVRVCNNAMDEVPTWEDATAAVSAGRGYLFTNQTKTAASWRINIWISIAKGTATERVRLDGFGGAFD